MPAGDFIVMMGGKTWSRDEEAYYWRVMIPKSPKAVNEEDRANSWAECASIMQEGMGKKARRKYTALMLFEHYFQNVRTGHKSPCAREFVVEHKRALELKEVTERLAAYATENKEVRAQDEESHHSRDVVASTNMAVDAPKGGNTSTAPSDSTSANKPTQ